MRTMHATLFTRAAFALVAMGSPAVFAQPARGTWAAEEAIHQAQRQQQIQQVQSDKAGYAAAIVERWEESARKAGRWDRTYSADLLASLTKLDPENLLAAGEASTYEAMMTVLARGKREPAPPGVVPSALGQNFQDLVYTPVTPCRIVDTRSAAAGALAGGVTRLFDVDGSSFTAQGEAAPVAASPWGWRKPSR